MTDRPTGTDPANWPGPLLTAAALVAPPVLCLALVPARSEIANTNAALLLVVVIVGFAATGRRAAGAAAALSAGVSFDFFLTEPYGSLSIKDRADLETALLLLIVGLGVSEIAAWGRRQAARASREEGYLAGVTSVSEVVARGKTLPSAVLARICDDLEQTLGLDACRFDYGTGLGYPRLHRDGRVTRRSQRWNVFDGVPTVDRPFELVAEHAGLFHGRFLLEAPGGLRLTHAQLRVATALADEAGVVLANASTSAGTPPGG